MARRHARHLDDAVVLGERGERQRPQSGGNDGDEPVGQNAAAQPSRVLVTFDGLPRHHGRGGEIPHRLEDAEQVDGARHHEGMAIERKTILEGHRDRDQRQAVQRREVHLAPEERDEVADDQAHRNAAHAQQRILHAVEEEHDEQHRACKAQVLEGAKAAVRLGAKATAKIGNADVHEAEADEHDDHPTDGGRDDFLQVWQQPGGEAHQECTHEGDPQQRRDHGVRVQPLGLHGRAQRDHHRDEREVDRLDGEHARPQRPKAVDLQPGADARGHHGHGHQVGRHVHGQFQGAAHDQRRGDHRHEDGQQVGDGAQQRIAERGTIFQSIDEIGLINGLGWVAHDEL